MNAQTLQDARAAAYAMPIEQIDVSDPTLFQNDTCWPYFERLRKEDPIHYRKDGRYGSFWSITKFKDIMAVDKNHAAFSSEAGGIALFDRPAELAFPMFIAMDPPRHTGQRLTVSPIVAPANLAKLSTLIRTRVSDILDGLPRGETFDWVERVSVNLTTQMLATLFDFPFEDRQLLTCWSDIASTFPEKGAIVETPDEKRRILMECLAYFTRLWNERIKGEPGSDLISMMAHSPATQNMTPAEFLGNLMLLIVGGNDTTRNSISGGILFMDRNPREFEKLRRDPALIPSAVSEIIRYQTPLAHMRRTALRDVEIGGKLIKAGDKVVMWYISGNRDDETIEQPDAFIIDRENPRHHISFGFGIHRCVGNRLAELQLTILWEELLKRNLSVRVAGDVERTPSNFVHGITKMPVQVSLAA